MALSEAQIVRFSRQILLREVGGKGQQRLLEGAVRVEGSGAALSEAVTYLSAGGSPLELPLHFSQQGFPLSPPGESERSRPDGTSGEPVPERSGGLGRGEATIRRVGERGKPLLLSAAEPAPDGPQVLLRGPCLAFRRADACPACWTATLSALPSTPPEPIPGLGALAALTAQRLILGWSDPHGLVRWTGERFQAETPRCAAHAGA